MMKTTTRKLLFLAAMVGLVGTSSFGQITTPPVIDGDGTDAVWGTMTAMELLRDNGSAGVSDAADFSGTVKAMWDADYIYVLLEVLDDTLDTESNNPWERDHYSVYFDLNNHKSTSYLLDAVAPMDSVQFMLEKIWSVEGDLTLEDTSMIWGMDFVEMIDSGTGYTVEMAIPLNLIGVDLAAGDIIGFDAKIGDNDADGSLDGKYSLYQTMDEGWQNPSYIGTAKLEADGSFSKVMHMPVLDGMDDYAWYGATEYKLLVDNIGETNGVDNAADFSGSVKTLWDDDNIYVLLKVMDDTLDTESNQAWERDNWSIYFDMANLKTTAYVKDTDATNDSVQFMLEKIWSVAGDVAFSNRVAALDSSMVEGLDFFEYIDSGKGYTLEMAVPLALLGVDVGLDDIIGFDAKIGDNDGDGSLDGKYSWHQRLDEGWQNPSYLGNIKLVAGELDIDMGTTMKAPAQIVIDGKMEGDWSQAVPMPLERENDITGVTDAADFSGVARALWDNDNFYVLLDVTDDSLNVDASWNPWERDHYTIYFDLDNLKTSTYVASTVEPLDSIQFNVEKPWTEPQGFSWMGDTLVNGVDFVEVIGETGYTVEYAFPFHRLGVDLSAYEGKMIGFDVKIGDNDGNNRDATLSWNQLADESWRNPSYMGEVTLMANSTVVGTPELEPQAVTFNVDMTGMISENIIDPAVDMVDIAGSLNNWGDPVMNMSDIDADGIYTITPDTLFLPGDVFEFKIRVNGSWDPISEFPGGGPNRTYTVVEGDNIIDIVFNDGDYTPWMDDAVNVDRASLIEIYPNPASSTLHIRNVEEISTLELVNLLGQVTYRQLNSGNASIEMSLDGQSSGVYMIRFTDADKNISIKKLIIE